MGAIVLDVAGSSMYNQCHNPESSFGCKESDGQRKGSENRVKIKGWPNWLTAPLRG